jgi:endonuclease/exonuclease/phosphatase family metal-dependent hydrolase
VTGGLIDFTLFAVWAYNPQDPNYKYIGQVWKAILFYENVLKNKNVILAGDFNSNVIWDKLKRKISHLMVIEKLATLNIFSTYHTFLNFPQGFEEHPTYYLYWHLDKPYHIDYCFASYSLIQKIENVETGSYRHWIKQSDHNPLIVSFKV